MLCVWRRKIKFLAVCCGIAVNLFCNLNFNWDWAGCDSGNGGTFTGPSEIEKAGHVDMCVHSNIPANHGMSGQREINDLFGTCSSVSKFVSSGGLGLPVRARRGDAGTTESNSAS